MYTSITYTGARAHIHPHTHPNFYPQLWLSRPSIIRFSKIFLKILEIMYNDAFKINLVINSLL